MERFLPDGNPHRRVLIIITHRSRVKLSSSAFNVVLCRFPVTGLVNFTRFSPSASLPAYSRLLLASLPCAEIPCKVKAKNRNENEI